MLATPSPVGCHEIISIISVFRGEARWEIRDASQCVVDSPTQLTQHWLTRTLTIHAASVSPASGDLGFPFLSLFRHTLLFPFPPCQPTANKPQPRSVLKFGAGHQGALISLCLLSLTCAVLTNGLGETIALVDRQEPKTCFPSLLRCRGGDMKYVGFPMASEQPRQF